MFWSYYIYVKLVVTDDKLVVADVKLVVPDVKLVDAGCEACGHQMLILWTQDVNTWGQYLKKKMIAT